MEKTITIKGASIMEVEQKAELLTWLSNNATVTELQKLKQLAQNPQMRALLQNL